MKYLSIIFLNKNNLCLIVTLISLLGYPAIVQADTSTLVVFKQNVFRAYSNGKFEKIFSAKDQHSNLYISPDQRHIVFEQDNDLWLLDVQTSLTERITNVGKPFTSKYTSVSAIFQLWSWDGNKILYRVSPGDTDDPEGERPELKVRPAKYGSYVFDLAKKISRPLEFPNGNLFIWLADGNFLIESNDNIIMHDVIDNTERSLINLGNGWQTSLSNDGKLILTTIRDKRMTTSQIIKMGMPQGQTTPITPIGKFTEYQWPTFSPSGKSIAYQHRIGTDNGKPVISLVVDGRDIYNYTGNLSYKWIEDSTIVVIERSQKEAAIIDVGTKKVKGRYKLKQ